MWAISADPSSQGFLVQVRPHRYTPKRGSAILLQNNMWLSVATRRFSISMSALNLHLGVTLWTRCIYFQTRCLIPRDLKLEDVSFISTNLIHNSYINYIKLTLRLLMSYIYGAPILDVSRSHTTTQHSR